MVSNHVGSEEKNRGPETGFVCWFVCLKLSKSLVTLVFMNQSSKARVLLEEWIQTEFLNI